MDFPTSNYIVFCQACFVFPLKFSKLGFSKKNYEIDVIEEIDYFKIKVHNLDFMSLKNCT